MDVRDAAALIAGGLPRRPPHAAPTLWADLGADRDLRAASALRARPRDAAAVVVHALDFADARAWDALALPPLDGVLLANALHYVAAGAQGALLRCLADALSPAGRLLVVEYEGRAPNPWVPHPVSTARLRELSPPGFVLRTVGSRASRFGGTMYAAAFTRVPPPDPEHEP
ncbi:hypothetical protein [Roseisolibacter sp. H3M3-2]|uniref:hypothetical protein n=1 Tax=Roseisolibacter sp. H3M3-2 TaxID=3031323 RepID=UPI0023DA91F2|nr:hypothetical protein [Roseisolibacter sp. H3M3-2]MDF1505709.1 hypothetical protein [Roseisolibacter sp. H3M3-2]